MSVRFLVDTNAWNRSNVADELSSLWTDLAESGKVALCPAVRFELLFSARGHARAGR